MQDEGVSMFHFYKKRSFIHFRLGQLNICSHQTTASSFKKSSMTHVPHRSILLQATSRIFLALELHQILYLPLIHEFQHSIVQGFVEWIGKGKKFPLPQYDVCHIKEVLQEGAFQRKALILMNVKTTYLVCVCVCV